MATKLNPQKVDENFRPYVGHLGAETLATVKYLLALEAYEDAMKLLGWEYLRTPMQHHFFPKGPQTITKRQVSNFVRNLGLRYTGIRGPNEGEKRRWHVFLETPWQDD